MNPSSHTTLASAASRRSFLKASGALVIAVVWDPVLAHTTAQGALRPAQPNPSQLDSWLAIHTDGSVTAFFGKIDMGHALDISIAQIVAEELDVAVEKVDVHMGDTATSNNQGGASSALGIARGALPLRNAAAEARRILLDMAAARLSVGVAELAVDDGVIRVVASPQRKTSYAELIGGKQFSAEVTWNQQVGNSMNVTGKAKPKAPSQYKVVGQSVKRRDLVGKVFGQMKYVTDIRLPGMLHARVIRPPAAGAGVASVDAASVSGIAGVQVVHEKNFLAVVAPREWDAVVAARELKVTWSAAPPAFSGHDKVHAHLRAAPVLKSEDPVKNGDLKAAFAQAARVVEAEYEWPFQSHASMGPACALADVQKEHATVWTGSQKPHYARDGVAAILGMQPEQVRGVWAPGPGTYGRNDAGDAVLEAAYLSKRLGKPVRLQYMRHDATGWDPKSPANVSHARAAIDASGQVTGYDFVAKGFSRADINSNESDPRHSLLGMALGLPLNYGIGFNHPEESYKFAAKRLGWQVVAPMLDRSSPLRSSHLRDPLGPDIHFASEQFIDELAYATGQDPLAFRLHHVEAARDAVVLRAAAERAGWRVRSAAGKRLQSARLHGQGIAYAQRAGTVVAVVAEVEVDPASGSVWARRVTVAHECGLIINPEGLRYTIEGNVTQGLSRTLHEEVQFSPTAVTSVDWDSYPILAIGEQPQTIDVVLINRPEAAPTGAGEPTIRLIPAAVANAFYDATGVRMRKAPLTRARVKAALA
ncbi:MAG: molybdopterin cofactor-binding domain-containing protein [Burkholderiaceae bacterium]